MSQPPSSITTTIQELRQAKSMLTEVVESLREQRDILKQRGMNLPPMVLKALSSLQPALDKLEESLIDEQAELGQLRTLADMSAQITTSLEVDSVLENTLDNVIALTSAERGFIILVNETTGEFDYRVQRDSTGSLTKLPPGQAPKISLTIVREVLAKREPLLADNAYKDARLQDNASIVSLTLRSVLCVPLMYKDTLFGVVYVDNRLQAGLFTEREKYTLLAFANTAGVAIANARLYAETQNMLAQITQVKDLMDNVFRSIGSGLIATDGKDTVTTFNRAAEEILELPADDTVGKPLTHVMPKIPADFSGYLTEIRETHEGQTLDVELTTQDRGRVAVSMKLSPLRDMNNQTSGVAIVLDDVTEQIARDQQLRVMKTYLPPEMVDNIHQISNLALGGERRFVTCMFVEVRPLTSLEDVHPNELMDILNEFFAVATDAVHDAQGVIDKYMGNELMVLWNTQLNPQNNHAQLALEGALLVRDRFLELYQRLGINPNPHYYRIGMHTGEATLGNVGSLNRRDFTAIGDTINLSKRLEENAAYGQIIISDDTRSHLNSTATHPEASYRFDELAPLQVKGRQQKTRIYEVFRKND